LREKSEAFVVKSHLSETSDVKEKNFSLVFKKRQDIHDSVSCDFYVLLLGQLVWSGRVQELRKLPVRVGLCFFSGRVESQNLDPRASLFLRLARGSHCASDLDQWWLKTRYFAQDVPFANDMTLHLGVKSPQTEILGAW